MKISTAKVYWYIRSRKSSPDFENLLCLGTENYATLRPICAVPLVRWQGVRWKIARSERQKSLHIHMFSVEATLWRKCPIVFVGIQSAQGK